MISWELSYLIFKKAMVIWSKGLSFFFFEHTLFARIGQGHLHLLSYGIFKVLCELGIIVFILQIKKLRLREAMSCLRSHD